MDIDIQSLVTRLQKSGLTQTEIGGAIGCSQSSVSDMANGKIGTERPAWKIVEGLKSLAERQGLRNVQIKNSPRRRSTDKEHKS